MGLLKQKEGTGGAQFEVVEMTTPLKLVQTGELEDGVVVYEADSKKRVESKKQLAPGKTYGTTVQAEYGC